MDDAPESAVQLLIDKLQRMPESNIKNFLNIAGPSYVEMERKTLIVELTQHIEHSTKPGYRRKDILERIKKLMP